MSSAKEDPSLNRMLAHYASYDESRRLQDGFGQLELERTRELILRFIPAEPSAILDIGGGSGDYSFWLAGLGHDVHLIDIVPRHVEQAKQRLRTTSAWPGRISLGDARNLDVPSESVHAVLLHGPLYHLTHRDDRVRCLSEARRVLRPGGTLLAFAITRYAGAIVGLTRGAVFRPDYLAMIWRELASGVRSEPPPWLRTLPDAYFHHPDELREEIADAGLAHDRTLGVVGPVWLAPDLDSTWEDPQKRAVLLDLARALENESVLGPRLMAVARREA